MTALTTMTGTGGWFLAAGTDYLETVNQTKGHMISVSILKMLMKHFCSLMLKVSSPKECTLWLPQYVKYTTWIKKNCSP